MIPAGNEPGGCEADIWQMPRGSHTPDADFELQYELPEHAVYVSADKSRMEQVLDNLIVNAKQNVRPGGVLKLSLKENGGALDFSIYNQGPPIPQENLSKIWTKFYRDKNSRYSGSGLGLAIVAQILSMHGLPYGVFNQPEGVVFYFSVPSLKQAATRQADEAAGLPRG